MEILAQIEAAIRGALANEMASSVAIVSMTLGAGGWLLYQARTLPVAACRFLLARFTLTVEVREREPAFDALQLWLAQHPDAKRARSFLVVHRQGDGRDQVTGDIGASGVLRGRLNYDLTPGLGRHFVRHQGRWLMVDRGQVSEPGKNASGSRPNETLTLKMLGTDPAALKTLVNEITRTVEDTSTVPVRFWQGGHFRNISRKLKRALDTVHIDPAQKARLVADLGRFLGAQQWYADRGIPWRRGYLLDGPPGTGKSTLIFALACAFDLPVSIISPSMVFSDGALLEAMSQSDCGIIVMEDFDAFNVTQERASMRTQRLRGDVDQAQPTTPRQPWERSEDDGGVTLSGLLNAIDGIASQDGRILFITSNAPHVLDPALLRPGRIDVREHLGLAGADVAARMHASFFPDSDAKAFVASLALPMAPAAIQNRLLETADQNPVGAIQAALSAALGEAA